MKTGLTALEAARLVCVLGAAAMGAVGFIGSRRILGLSVLGSVGLAVVCVVAPTVPPVGVGPMAVWSYALSESLYVPLALVTVFMGIIAVRKSSWPWIVGTAVLVGALSLVRATGPAIGVALAWTFVMGARRSAAPRRRTLVSAAIVGLGGFVAAGVWQATNRSWHGGSGAARSFGVNDFHGVVEVLLRTCAGWFGVPASAPLVVAAVVAFVGIVGPCGMALVGPLRRIIWEDTDTDAVGTAAVALAAALVVSVGVVLASRAFLDASLYPDARLLAPAQPFAYLLAAVVGRELVARARWLHFEPYGPAVPAILLALVVLLPAVADLPAGRDHVARASIGAMVYQNLRGVSDEVLFVTNTPDRLWLDTGAPSIVLPPKRFVMTGAVNPHFESDLAVIARLARRRPVLVVVTPDVNGWPSAATTALARQDGFAQVSDCGPAFRVWAAPGSRAAALARRACGR